MTDIDRKKYVRISKLTDLFKELGNDVSEGTVRRWVKDYAEFFKTVRLDGWLQVEYEPALPVLTKIKAVIGIGRNRGKHEVRDALLSEFQPVSDTPMLSEVVKVVGTDGEKVLVDFTPEAWEKLESMFKKGG